MTKSESEIIKWNTENWAAKSRFIVAWQIRKNREKALGSMDSIQNKNKARRELKDLFDRKENNVYQVRGWDGKKRQRENTL